MTSASPARAGAQGPWPGSVAMLAWVAGTAWQLRQPRLSDMGGYLACTALAALLLAVVWRRARRPVAPGLETRARAVFMVTLALAVAALAWGTTGWRALAYQHSVLAHGGQDADVRLTGIVASMPQASSGGWRWRMVVESVQPIDAQQQALPQPQWPRVVWAGWWAASGFSPPADAGHGNPALAPLRAGERWALTVRLKAPHGLRNPHGFDQELWLWEQGIQASASVRVNQRAAAPQRLAQTGQYPVQRWRQQVRDRLLQRVGGEAEPVLAQDPRPAPEPPDAAQPAAATAPALAESGRGRIAGILAALVTGDQAAVERQDWDLFRVTGVAHLMSISGLHITLFAWLAVAFVGGLWRRCALWGGAWGQRLLLRVPAPLAAGVGGLALAGLYALFSGWGVPAQRTVLMLAVVTALALSGRRWPWPTVWLLAAAVVVAYDPWALLQAGFWLSFVAVGILFATPESSIAPEIRASKAVDSAAPGIYPSDDKATETAEAADQAVWSAPWPGLAAGLTALSRARSWLLGPLGRLLKQQGRISLALAPLSLLLFGQASVVGLLANLLAIPWVTLVITPLALLGVLWAPLWDLAAWALAPLMQALGLMAQWPWAVWSWPAVPLWAGGAAVLAGAMLVLHLPWPWRALAGLYLLPALLWLVPRPAVGHFDLRLPDVGQGSAVLVRTARHSLLYDAGPLYGSGSDAGLRVVLPLLRALGERPDLLLLSHRDTDHVGGAAALLRAQPGLPVMASDTPGALGLPAPGLATRLVSEAAPEAVPEAVADLSATPFKPWQPCLAGQHWQWDGVQFLVLHPQASASPPAAGPVKANARSCVLRVSARDGTTALLSGDIEVAQERALIDANAPLKTDVLVLAHHGSKTSSSAGWLQATAPRWAVAQASWRNRFGHPAPAVVGRLRQLGVPLATTIECGALDWHSAQPMRMGCQRRDQARYWQHEPPAPGP